MAIQFVNVGSAPNDGTGDPLRIGFIKINENFAEIEVSLANVLTDVSDLQIDVDTLQAEVAVIQGDIITIQGDISTIESDITTIEGDITNIENNIDNLNLNNLTDVEIITPLDNQILSYEALSGLWKNKVAAASGITTAINGLTQSPAGTVKWGGNLTEDTIINATNKTISYTSNLSTPFIFINASGTAIFAQTLNGVGLTGSSVGNYGVLGTSNTKAGLAGIHNSPDNSTVKPVLELGRITSGPTPVNGIGQSIIFTTQNATGNDTSNEIISKWVDAIANTSEFSITGVFANNPLPLFTLRGNGLARLNQYGVTQPLGVGSPAFALNIDNTGNIIQVPIGTSGAVVSIVPGTNITVNNTDPANPIVSAIPSTSAGVFDRVYFTGQVASVATPVGPNYDSIRNGKGSVASVALVVAGLNASTKLYIPNDIIGPAQSVAGTLPLGNYTGFLSVQASAAISLKRFTIEVFLCDNAGVIIPSSGPASGSTDPFYAGKNTVTILDSGDLNLGNGTVTQVGLTSYLANAIPVAIGQRFRYHISVSRGAAGGGAQTMTVFIGNTSNSYVEAPVPITTSTVVNVSNVPGATATDALNALTQWRGNWVAGTYQKNQQVLDNSFLAIANKVTTDRPAPQPIGTPGNVYTASSIPTASVSAKQVIFGNRYSFAKDVILQAWRVNVVAGNNYSIYLVENPLGTPIVSQIINYTAQRNGWISLNVPKTIIKSGSTYDLVATVSQPATSPTTFTANYNYKKPTNSTLPGAKDVNQAMNLTNTLRFSYTDNDLINRAALNATPPPTYCTTCLGNLSIGDIIIGDNTRWAIQSKTIDNVNSNFSFVVSPATQLASTGVKTFTFESVATTPITYPVAANYWSTNPPSGITAQGLLAIDASYVSIVNSPNTNAYGVDILIQEIVPSLDWDIQAFSETSAGGSDSGSSGYTVVSPVSGATLTDTSGEIVVQCNSSAGAFTLNLPTAVNNTAKYHIKKTAGANSVTINAFSGQNIDGGTTAVINVVGASITLVSNNANWLVI